MAYSNIYSLMNDVTKNGITEVSIDLASQNADQRHAQIELLSDFLQVDKKITSLSMIHCNLDDSDATLIANALKTNTTLNNLELWQNKIGPDGATDIANALKENTGLEYIAIAANPIGNGGAIAFAELLKEILKYKE